MPSAGARRSMGHKHSAWTHESVLALAAGANPVDAITAKARQTVFRAIEAGWSGPPYDPFALAEFLKISAEPRQDVIDARTISVGAGRFRIEFNPNRSAARINFSVAHEIAHTLFPDCGETTRNRYTHAELTANDWELEVLCNIGAAEILMPVGSFRTPESAPISIEAVLELQRQFLVSTESILLRIARLANQQCFVFAAHRDEKGSSHLYRIDYTSASRSWPITLETGFHLPKGSVLAECTAIGFTAKREEEWIPSQ